jgi:DnaJ-class molecular chaperone
MPLDPITILLPEGICRRCRGTGAGGLSLICQRCGGSGTVPTSEELCTLIRELAGSPTLTFQGCADFLRDLLRRERRHAA